MFVAAPDGTRFGAKHRPALNSAMHKAYARARHVLWFCESIGAGSYVHENEMQIMLRVDACNVEKVTRAVGESIDGFKVKVEPWVEIVKHVEEC